MDGDGKAVTILRDSSGKHQIQEYSRYPTHFGPNPKKQEIVVSRGRRSPKSGGLVKEVTVKSPKRIIYREKTPRKGQNTYVLRRSKSRVSYRKPQLKSHKMEKISRKSLKERPRGSPSGATRKILVRSPRETPVGITKGKSVAILRASPIKTMRRSPSGSPRISPRASPKVNPRRSPKISPRRSSKIKQRRSRQGSPRRSVKIKLRVSPKVSPRRSWEGSPIRTTKIKLRASLRRSLQGTPKISPKGSIRVTPRATPTISPRISPKISPRRKHYTKQPLTALQASAPRRVSIHQPKLVAQAPTSPNRVSRGRIVIDGALTESQKSRSLRQGLFPGERPLRRQMTSKNASGAITFRRSPDRRISIPRSSIRSVSTPSDR